MNVGSEQSSHSSFHTYTEYFYDAFPYYLSIGMTPEQYWDGDPCLTIYYKRADELKVERRNYELWLQGLYVYEAICDVSPILQGMAKKGTKAHPYSDKPYAITEKQRQQEIADKEREVAAKGKRMMERFVQMSKEQNK